MREGGADIRFLQHLLGHAKLDTTATHPSQGLDPSLQEMHGRCRRSARLRRHHPKERR
ncbi:MAG: hypothetical protein IT580_14320 [Verrucomicrobiales bacterium]|nr:hypothetical protein [Verrucomicrobiales bacterium]